MCKSYAMKNSSFSSSNFSLNVRIEFFKTDSVAVITSDGMHYVQKLQLAEAIVQLDIDLIHILEINFSFSLVINQVKSFSTSFFSEWISDFVGQLSNKAFKVKSISLCIFIDILEYLKS
eukprot:TRINITY_DN3035_c0_g1_i2.p1 TRINITY_DN3035_c0_g1~~TRINITY_DN3035_c0_g1_i2.p1  ORF type:complete len:119 (+),score=12.26 TRINITY_DN3035_c0_g1_i2:25-381(+)